MADSIDERHRLLGAKYDQMTAQASIERCNCMVRYKDGPQMPAIRHGKDFMDPEGRPIMKPTSFEDMHHNQIKKIMVSRNEVYIGHMFEPFL